MRPVVVSYNSKIKNNNGRTVKGMEYYITNNYRTSFYEILNIFTHFKVIIHTTMKNMK